MTWGCILISLIYMQMSIFPAPFAEETVLFPSYVFASFVKEYLTIGFWIYFWALYYMFHWSICLFLYQYLTVLITIALWYCLMSQRVTSPAFSFFFFYFNDFYFFPFWLVYSVLSIFFFTSRWPSHMYIYIHFSSHILTLHHKWLYSIVPGAIQKDLIAYPFQRQ